MAKKSNQPLLGRAENGKASNEPGADFSREEPRALLRASSLTAGYGGSGIRPALENIDIELRPGELTLLIGPNGGGKSTLLKSLSRTLKPKSGSVYLSGDDLYEAVNAKSAARSISVVPQDTSIAFEFSVREIAAMGRSPYQPAISFGFSESEADSDAIETALDLVDIPKDYYFRSIASLSGGEKQRVSIAKAIAQDTKAILLDEPTSSLDLRHTEELLGLLKSLAREKNRMVAAAIHDINLAAAWGDRIIVVDNGKIAADGPPNIALNVPMIEKVYGVNVWRRFDPISGAMCLQILPKGNNLKRFAGKRAHVVSGAGAGAKTIWSLHEAKAEVSAGIISQADPEADICAAAGIKFLSNPPYSILKAADKQKLVEFARNCDLIVVAGKNFGEANAVNLEAAAELAGLGIRIIADEKIQSCLQIDEECGTIKQAISKLRSRENVRFAPDPAVASLEMLAAMT